MKSEKDNLATAFAVSVFGITILNVLLDLLVFSQARAELEEMEQKIDSIQVVVDSTQINTDYLRFD